MLRSRLGWFLVVASLLLHAFTVLTYSVQPDRLAAFTVLPFWLWCGMGLGLSVVAYYFLKASLSLIVSGIWAITLLIGSDECKVLANIGKQPPITGQAEPYRGKPVIRVASLNCALLGKGDPSLDLARWQPDIVLLQEVLPDQVQQISTALFGKQGDFRYHQTNAVITRWKIRHEIRNHTYRNMQVSVITPTGMEIKILNLHLLSAATDLQLWRRDAWKRHHDNRRQRKIELSNTLQMLEETSQFPNQATIIGGDFNAPATDVVHRQLTEFATDAFQASGTGWGNTFPWRFPILRIDFLYATNHLTPVRCRAVTTRHSDHRLVIADFITHPNPY